MDSPEGAESDSFYPEEEPGGASGLIRDFTRRYGVITPVEGGLLRTGGGCFWEPVDTSSVRSIFEKGLRKVELPEGVIPAPLELP